MTGTLDQLAELDDWTPDLPFNVKFRVQSGNRHSRGRSFYNPETQEVLHRAHNYRKTHPDKMYAMVTDVDADAHSDEKLYRRALPGVADEVVTVWSGSSGETLEQVTITPDPDTYGTTAPSMEAAMRIVDEALLEYAETGDYTGPDPALTTPQRRGLDDWREPRI